MHQVFPDYFVPRMLSKVDSIAKWEIREAMGTWILQTWIESPLPGGMLINKEYNGWSGKEEEKGKRFLQEGWKLP